jgi:hypothetical protein
MNSTSSVRASTSALAGLPLTVSESDTDTSGLLRLDAAAQEGIVAIAARRRS